MCWICHIPVTPPALNHTDYYNRKGWYSVVLQAVVDHEYLFRDVYVGWPGSVHDARVLANSSLYKKATNKKILCGDNIVIGGVNVPVFLVGDSAYPLSMKPFPHNSTLTHDERVFNDRLCRARVVVENGFGRLKARWRRLSKRNDMNINNVPCIVTACVILHNLCEIHGDTFNQAWLDLQDTSNLAQPTAQPNTTSNNDAKIIRDKLVAYYKE